MRGDQANLYDDEGWRYGIRFSDGSVSNTWNGSTQRQRATEFLAYCRERWPRDAPKLSLVRKRHGATGWVAAPMGFVCPVCFAESWHPKDLEHGWCGRCYAYTGMPGALGDLIRQQVRDRLAGCICKMLPASPAHALDGQHHPACPLFEEADIRAQ